MSKMGKSLLFCGVLLLSVILGMKVYASYPDLQMKCYLNKQEYGKAVNMYNTKFAELEDHVQYEDLFLEHIKEIKATWKEDKLSYKEAVTLLEQIMKMEQESIASEAARMKEFILVQGQGNECCKKAEEYCANGAYADALGQIAKIDSSYLEYSKVEQLQEQCVNAILEQTNSIDTVDEYESWIQKLSSYYEIVPEAAFLTRKAQLEQEVSVFKDVINILKEVADHYGQTSYGAAFSKLESGLEKYPDYGKLKESYQHYHKDYVSKVTEEVEELCEREEYDRALEEAEYAKNAHDCEEFQDLIEYVKEEKSVLYKWKNNILDFFEKFRK